MSGAREDVVKGVAEQANDGVELVIPDRHSAGKIAFHEQRRPLVRLLRSSGKGNVSPKWLQRSRL
jgi:hypothetical protein